MPVTTATYSGRFIRPSSLTQATPIFLQLPQVARQGHVLQGQGASRLPCSTQPYFSRQGWAHSPRLPLRPPMTEEKKHWPE